MEQWLRDALAEEMGYTICPISGETYTICDNDCEHCQDYINFIKGVNESFLKGENNESKRTS